MNATSAARLDFIDRIDATPADFGWLRDTPGFTSKTARTSHALA
jgi:hypothetical protein